MNVSDIKAYLQIRYNENTKKCKSLHLQLDMLYAELAYYKEQFKISETQDRELKIIGVKGQLNSLWHKQVDLYFEINKQTN